MSDTDLSAQNLSSVHTNTMPQLLNQLGISLLVSTYQAQKLIIIRSEGSVINTHFRVFDKPMGITTSPNKFALGSGSSIWEFYNVPNAAAQIEPIGTHDACFIPRNIHVTGDIDIHEMAWDASDELWFINTKFSCLCTADKNHSFIPRWKPPFISGYDMTDRCHLNGLAIRDGKPRYITALGESDEPTGWRSNKATGGILMDIESNRFICRGLSMPHSPRWYRDKLWVLESGRGGFGYVNEKTGEITNICTLPGFTRGIDFCGDFAFIGLSKVRETAVFSGIPLTQQISERIAGVWAVHIETGQIIAFLRFESGVEEIFAVSVLPNTRFPEVLEWGMPQLHNSFVLPDDAIKEVSNKNRDMEFAVPIFEEGNELYNGGDKKGAIEKYKKCLQIQPDYLPALFNIGIALGDLEQYDEAITALSEVVKNEASHAEAYNSMGFIYNRQGKVDRAIEMLENALHIRKDFAQAHFNLGMALLSIGEYSRGWDEYAWRLKLPATKSIDTAHPMWDGSYQPDKTILIHTEQGSGDSIQMARFFSHVKERCKHLIVVCTPNLQPLFKSIASIDTIYNAGSMEADLFDMYAPIMSLPHLLNIEPSQYTTTSSYFQADPSVVPLGEKSKKLRIGIVWAGSSTHDEDKRRSIELSTLFPLFSIEDIEWISLQSLPQSSQIETLQLQDSIRDMSQHMNTYADTASIITQLDLVIGVDTSVVHLGGALNIPTWIMLSYVPDWRWLNSGNTTPWYPCATLFRQDLHKNWDSVIKKIVKRLKSFE